MGMWLVAASPFFLNAQNIPSPVTFSLAQTSYKAATGDTVLVTVEAEIEEPWHLYSVLIEGDGPIPTSFSIKSAGAKMAGAVQESKAVRSFDPNFNIEVGWHSEQATFVVPVVFTQPDSRELTIAVRYMACDDKSCQPPRTIMLTAAVELTGEVLEPVEVTQDADTAVALAEDYSSVWSFLWIAITAGFAALLTPCVFPMIPLTVSYFTKQGDGTRAKSITQALLFGVSIVGTFTLLGVLLSLVIGASGAGQFASNPWVNLIIGLVFIVFAVSLLGMFELQLPYQVTNFLNRKSQSSSGFAGLLFMGLTISAVSFSCTAPFVGGVLAATASGEWFYPILGMIGFSAAFSLPFVFFAMFPQAMQSLPKSGSWMNTVKVMLGFVELAAAFKFISNADLVWQWGVVTRPLTIAFWIVIATMAALYLLGKITMPKDYEPQKPGFGGFLTGMAFLSFAVYLLPGLMGASLGIWDAWLPPKQPTDVSLIGSIAAGKPVLEDETWTKDYEGALQSAAVSGKPVLIDFTGYTCTNCRAMEANVFPLPEIAERFAAFEKVQLYTDDGVTGPEHQLFQFKLTGTVALPTYAVVDPASGQLLAKLSGYSNAEDFAAFLDRGLKKYAK